MPAEMRVIHRRNWKNSRRLPFTEVLFSRSKTFATPDVPEEVLWQVVSEAINFP